MADSRPLAMLDSGIGGLSILREVRRQLPHEDILYFADQAHVPYGPRSMAEIQGFCYGITEFFIRHEAKAIVIACNTASAAALYPLRERYPEMPFVGMEPAVKPAAERSRSGVIAVLATKTTFQGELFASVVGRFAQGKQVIPEVCPDFVQLVEAGELDSEVTRAAVHRHLDPLLAAGVDQIVLGCTHFPFLTPMLEEVAGPGVEIVDPSAAVARQAGRVLAGMGNVPGRSGEVTYYSSGDLDAFHVLAQRLAGEPVRDAQVQQARWEQDLLRLPVDSRFRP